MTRKRRREEGKTDYRARLNLLKSNLPRIVFRKTNKYIIGQYVKSEEAKDKVVIGVNSKMLLKYGWNNEMAGSLKSLPASYLTGFLLGRKIIDKEDKTKAVFDLGLIRNVPKSRAYAFLKGVVDAGVDINCNEKIFPDEARISGKHMKKSIDFQKIRKELENA